MTAGRPITVRDIDIEVYEAIYAWFESGNLISPSMVDLLDITSVKSKSHMRYILGKLEAYGVITRQKRIYRSICLVGAKIEMPPRVQFCA